MSLSPEAQARVTAIKATAESLRDVPPNDPRIYDFVRNGKGAGDILWLAGQLEKAHKQDDDTPCESEAPPREYQILEQVRTLVGAASNEEVVDKVAALTVPSERELPEGHGLAYGVQEDVTDQVLGDESSEEDAESVEHDDDFDDEEDEDEDYDDEDDDEF